MGKNINPYKNLIDYQLEIGIGNVKGFDWISVHSSKGGIYRGPWILVPEKIKSYDELLFVIHQLPILPQAFEKAKAFNFPNPKKIKHLLFAYLLGILVGDASKPTERKNVPTRRIGLTLTKKYKSNKRLGEFVCFCANSLGLNMKRIKDLRKGNKNTHPFYRWNSEKSPLIQWIFNVCLGLRDDQVTTYDEVNLEWIFSATKEFKTWFLQGIADSDGYVDFNSFQAGIISTPNTALIKRIVESLGVKTSVRIFRKDNLEAVVISIDDAYKISLFSPIVNSYRYLQMKKLATAQKLHWHMPEELRKKIKSYLLSGLGGSALVKKLLEEENVRVRTKTIRRLRKGLRGE